MVPKVGLVKKAEEMKTNQPEGGEGSLEELEDQKFIKVTSKKEKRRRRAEENKKTREDELSVYPTSASGTDISAPVVCVMPVRLRLRNGGDKWSLCVEGSAGALRTPTSRTSKEGKRGVGGLKILRAIWPEWGRFC